MSDRAELEVAVFNAALQLPPRRRAAYLEEACGADRRLRGRVETLLRAHDRAGAFLEEPAVGRLLVPAGSVRGGQDEDFGLPGAGAAGFEERVGRYRLLQQIGEGGCGVVYLAEQEEPVRRRVALKIIKLGMDTRSVIARFEAERQALALMDHPNIARVFDAGATATGRPYFVMELVRGLRITEYCDQHRLSPRDRLELFTLVCRAVQHAHQKGIIHRDLKPSNILVTVNDGVAVPKVIDFGIAKATQGRLTDQTYFTAFEQFLGTPAYMSPEQSVLTSVDIDTRSDIYSLGVLLYELMAGKTPFDQQELFATGLEAMRRTLREKEPVRPSTRLSAMVPEDLARVARHRQSEPPRLIHYLRGDLDWIVMRCLEKDRARRYETANGLARDVERFLAHEPIVARPPSTLYRLRKLLRRHRLTFTAAGAVLGALLLGLGFSTWQFLQKSRAEREQSRLREEAQAARANEADRRRQAEVQEEAARRKAYASDMNLLQLALAAEDLGRAQELLNRQRPAPGWADLRGWEWRHAWPACQTDAAFSLCQRPDSIIAVSFAPDASLLAVSTWSDEVTVWDVATRQLVFRHGGSGGGRGRLAFSPHSPLLAFGDTSQEEQTLVLWDCAARRERHRLPLQGVLRDLAFTRDGRLYTADLGRSNNIAVWDVARGLALGRFTAGLPGYGNGTLFAVAADGNRFAHVLGGSAHSVRVVEAETGQATVFRVAEELCTSLAFVPGGRTLVTGAGYGDGRLQFWGLPAGEPEGSGEGHRSWVSCLKVLPGGRVLASASADRTIRLWDIETRRPIRALRGQGGELWTLDVSPDGRWLASGCKDGTVMFWDLGSATQRPPTVRTLQPGGVSAWAFSPDGRWLGALRHGRIQLVDARTLEPRGEPALPMTNILGFTFSADSRLLVATDDRGFLGAWDLDRRSVATHFPAHPVPAYVFASGVMPPEGNLLTCDLTHTAIEWDPATWKAVRRWDYGSDKTCGAIAPAGGWVATVSASGAFELIQTREPSLRRDFTGESRVVAMAFSPDGRTLAAASENGAIELWDAADLTRIARLRGVLLGYHSVAFSPDGRRLIAGSNGQEAIKIWDLQSREEVGTLPGQGSFFTEARFSPDGHTIGARNWNGVIHLWTAPSWEQVEAAERAQAGTPR